jgi:hypothetical protein
MTPDNRITRALQLAKSFGLSAFLTACATPGAAPVMFPPPSAPALAGLERGSSLQSAMSGEDKRAIAQTAGALLAEGRADAAQRWSDAAGNSGDVRLGAPYLVGLDATAGAPVPAPQGIDTSEPLEAANGNYTALKTANVRLGPSTSATIVGSVVQDSTVRAYGHVASSDWYLIGSADAVTGYVYGPLLEQAGGGAPILAGGRAKRPRLCRNLSLTMQTADGRSDAWSALACRTNSGTWQVPSERGLS